MALDGLHLDVPVLDENLRNLRALVLHLQPVLQAVVAGETDVSALARRVGIEEDDARRALFLLEEMGLLKSTRYIATPEGRRALQERR